ncbi:MAG TPA: hypothetical protein VFQ45_06425 [Longimicrobium sp.]|nr:hypothetical protein [Longimicrobium sp.]
MKYPLRLSFKKVALAPQIYVRDADGQLRMYVKQKLMKLKESVTVFADEEQRQPLYRIDADRVLDFNARYHFTTADGRELGGVRRKGRRSLWKASYEVERGGEVILRIGEQNPWAKVGDALFGQIPVVGLFAGYLFHPVYNVTRPDGDQVLRVAKRRALFEGEYDLDRLQDMDAEEEGLAVLSVLMMLLLERTRG